MIRTVEVVTTWGRVAATYAPTHGYAVEASSIGLKPGVWPDALAVWASSHDDPTQALEMLTRGQATYAQGDLVSVMYWSRGGTLSLEVFND